MKKYLMLTISILIIIVFISCMPALEENVSWTEYNTEGVKPCSRYGHSMAYVGYNKLIIFGGYSSTYLQDTWEYDINAHTWTEYNQIGTKPSARNFHSMTYIGNGRLIMFGGYSDSGNLQDTWEYDINAHTWTEYNQIGTKPSARKGHAMAYVGNNKLIMYGGKYLTASEEYNYFSDTWEYNVLGHTWTESDPDTKPPARALHSMAYIDNNKLVMFGGYVNKIGNSSDTWEYDLLSKNWECKAPNTHPSKRISHSMAYVGNSKVIMFGGYGSYSGQDYLSDTWIYDTLNNSWVKCNIETKSPSTRYNHSIAYIGTGKIIMFGGRSSSNYLEDTWECNTGNLTDRMTHNSDVPILAVTHAILDFGDEIIKTIPNLTLDIFNDGTGSFDYTINNNDSWIGTSPVSGTISSSAVTTTVTVDTNELSIGNNTGSITISSSTPEVLGSPKVIDIYINIHGIWEEHTPGTKPTSRYSHTMAYGADDKAVLFGGYDTGYLQDTWEYDSSSHTWTEWTLATKPAVRDYHAMAYTGNGKILIFGGYNGSYLQDTWEYDSSSHTWTEYTLGIKPCIRSSHAMAYIGSGKVIMFGGLDEGGISVLQDTWEYDSVGHSWTEYTPGIKPPARRDHAMAYVGNGKVIMFGGTDGGVLQDTWEYDSVGHRWVEYNTGGTKPPAQKGHSMVYIGDDKLILFGDYNNSVWLYDISNHSWTEYNTEGIRPSMRTYHDMAYLGNGKIIMFGGTDGSSKSDTWEYYAGNIPGSF